MTRYTVIWDTDVEAELTLAWLDGDSELRATLREIADWVDKNLTSNPDTKGEPRADLSARILAVPVSKSSARAAVTYTVADHDRQVRVVRIAIWPNA